MTINPAPSPASPQNMRAFLTIWIGQLVSGLGSSLTSFALAVWIFQQTGKATPFALTVLLGNLPFILLSPLAGSAADRCNRRRIMILADTGNALVTLALVFLMLGGDLQVWHIYLLALGGSVFGAFQSPAYMASVSMLVPKKDLARANGLSQMGDAVLTIATPLIAGFLFVAIGLRGIVLIDFITYFAAIGTLLIVRIPQPASNAPEDKSKSSFWQDTLFGWKYLRDRPGLFSLLWYYAMVNFVLTSSTVLIGPLLLSRYPASTLGMVQMTFGLGMLGGGLVMSAWRGPKRRIPAVILFISIAMTGLIVAGLRPQPIFPAVGLFILLFAIPLASGNSQVVFQTKVAAAIQGRVFAIRGMIAHSIIPLAQASSGPLADYVFGPLMRENGGLTGSFVGALLGSGPGRGIGLMFVVYGLAAILFSVIAYANPRLRRVEDELPDALAD